MLRIIYVYVGWIIIDPMQSTEDKIKAISEAAKREDHSEVYSYAKQLLKDHPEDTDYLLAYIVAAFKAGVADELASSHFKHPPANEAVHHLYAYFLYDRGEFDKAIHYINSVKSTPSLRLLLAQAHFRAQNYDKSAGLMLALLKETSLSEEDREEYLINLLATGLNPVLTAEVVREYEKALLRAERKELLYNYSLVMFEAGDFQKCQGYLREFEGSLVAGRDDNDLAMVRLFRDFLEWRCSRSVEKGVVDSYERLQEKVTDRNVRGVISNNLLFFRQGSLTEHTHEILRMMDETLETEFKMTKKQRALIHLNKLSVLLRKGRLPEAQKLLREIESREEVLTDGDFLKNKYYLLKKTKDEGLQAFVDQVKAVDPNLAFCLRADLEKERENETSLIGDLRAAKGMSPVVKNYIFSLLVKHSSLFEQYSDYLADMAELTTDASVLRILLNLYENKADLEKQKFILLRLLKLQPKLASAKVKLARLYLAERKTAEAEEVLRGIEGPEELGDIAYLQFIEKNIHVSTKKEEEVQDQTKKEDAHKKRIRKRKRVRLPKGVERAAEGYKADPERWLPKWQRKGYKKKGKKGGAGKTQGLATVGKEETKNVYTTGASTSGKEVTRDQQKKRKN